MKAFWIVVGWVIVTGLRTISFAQDSANTVASPRVDASAAVPKNDDGTFLKRHAAILERGKAGPIRLLFLGDSITANWTKAPHIWDAYFGRYAPANFGVAGDATQNVVWRIAHGELDGIRPQVVVLMLGTNNTASHTAAEIVAADEKIVGLIREKIPEAKVLVLGILPRGERKLRDGSIDTGEEKMKIIREVNRGLAKLDQGGDVRFLDFGDRFLGHDNKPPISLMPDQLHPSPAGYQLWAEAMQPLLEGLMAGRAAVATDPRMDRPVRRLDPALDAFVSPDAKVELVAEGFGFTEGPVWVPRGGAGYLLFTDVPANVVYKVTPENRQATVYLYRAGFTGTDIWHWGGMNDNGRDPRDPRYEEFPMAGADGLTVDRQGRLIICTFAGRSIDRIEDDGTRTVLVDNFEGKRFGGTNDVVVKSDGAIYFTDTFGGMRLRAKDPHRELDFNGVYRWQDGQLALLIKDMPNTNGLAFSPDEKFLYVNGSRDNYVKRYDVLADGTLANGRLFIDLANQPEPGVTDGLRVDTKGNLYETGPGGVWIISPEGKHLGTIHAPEKAINVAFGDADKRTLYIAAHTSIYKIRVNTPGI